MISITTPNQTHNVSFGEHRGHGTASPAQVEKSSNEHRAANQRARPVCALFLWQYLNGEL
jgi:hypothetical protein